MMMMEVMKVMKKMMMMTTLPQLETGAMKSPLPWPQREAKKPK